MICLSELINLHVFQMKQGKKVGRTTGFAARIGGYGIDALTVYTDEGQSRLLRLDCVKSVGAFGLTIDQEDAFISEQESSEFLLFDMQALRKVITVDEQGQFLGTILDMEWLPEQLQMKSFILLDQGEKVKIFYPNVSIMGQDMIVLNVRFPHYDLEQRIVAPEAQVEVEVSKQAEAELLEVQTEVQELKQAELEVAELNAEKKEKSKPVAQRKTKKTDAKKTAASSPNIPEQVKATPTKKSTVKSSSKAAGSAKVSSDASDSESEIALSKKSKPEAKSTRSKKTTEEITAEKIEKVEVVAELDEKKELIVEKNEIAEEIVEKAVEKSTEKTTIVKKNEQGLQEIKPLSLQDFSERKKALPVTEGGMAVDQKAGKSAIDDLEEEFLEDIVETSDQDVLEAVQQAFPELSQLEKGILEKQIHILLNRRLTAPVFTGSGDLIFKAGTLLTLERILKVQRMSPLLILDCAQNIEL